MGYLRPTAYGEAASWWNHKHRAVPSKEPGTDYACPVNTPVHAADAGRVSEIGGSVDDPTGRYLTLDLDDGCRVRYLHLWEWKASEGDPVRRGEVVALSGASGFGSEWGAGGDDTVGPHVHTTLFPRQWYDFDQTLDFEARADGFPGGGRRGGGRSLLQEDDMFNDDDRARLQDAQNKLSVPGVGYGLPQVIQQRVDDLQIRILPAGQPYDNVQLIISMLNALTKAVTGDADVPTLLAEMELRLRAEFDLNLQTRLAEYNGRIREDIAAALADAGVPPDTADNALDIALGKATDRLNDQAGRMNRQMVPPLQVAPPEV